MPRKLTEGSTLLLKGQHEESGKVEVELWGYPRLAKPGDHDFEVFLDGECLARVQTYDVGPYSFDIAVALTRGICIGRGLEQVYLPAFYDFKVAGIHARGVST